MSDRQLDLASKFRELNRLGLFGYVPSNDRRSEAERVKWFDNYDEDSVLTGVEDLTSNYKGSVEELDRRMVKFEADMQEFEASHPEFKL